MFNEGMRVLLGLFTIQTRSGHAMKMLKRFIIQHKLQQHVRSLEFANFNYFSAGGLSHYFTPGVISPISFRFDTVNGDIHLMTICPSLRKIQFKIECTYLIGYPERICCYDTYCLMQRYQFYDILGGSSLNQIIINLSVWDGRAIKVLDGRDSFCYGEDLAR